MTPPSQSGAVVSDAVPEGLYRGYLAALLANDHQRCRGFFEQLLAARIRLRSLYENLVQRSLYEIGERWERGEISVATEHAATAISESLLNLTYSRLFEQPRNGKSAVVSCAANEHHQIGGKMVADIFELHGWRGYFVGANAPMRELHSLISEKRPNVVAFSLASLMGLDPLVAAVTEVRAAYPHAPILVGGQAFRLGKSARIEGLAGVKCLMSLGELEGWIMEHRERD